MLSHAEALACILAEMVPLSPVSMSLDAALDRVLAEDIVSADALPPFDNSAMDGFAVVAADLAGATPEFPMVLRILADQPAGTDAGITVDPGTALRIMTGAPMPLGADAVVPVELTSASGDAVQMRKAVRAGANLRRAGEDVRVGECALKAGIRLRPAELALLAAVGRPEVSAIPVPRVAILTTGDELVDVSEPLGPARIRDANIHALCAQVRACGAIPVPIPRVADTSEAMEAAIRAALSTADVICTNGGVSMGDHDHVRPVLERLGAESRFWQVAQKPGRPMAFSVLNGKPVFGIPGNPVAAQICFEVYVRPALLKLMGRTVLCRPVRTATLAEPLRKPAGDTRTHFLRVLLREEAGQLVAQVNGPQGSGLLTSMTRSQALLVVPPDAHDLPAGAPVAIHLTDLAEDH